MTEPEKHIIVEMTTDLRPYHRGQHVPLPEALAEQLLASGEAINPRPFPEQSIADREIVQPPRPPPGKAPRRRYLTK